MLIGSPIGEATHPAHSLAISGPVQQVGAIPMDALAATVELVIGVTAKVRTTLYDSDPMSGVRKRASQCSTSEASADDQKLHLELN